MNEKWCRGRGCRSKQFKFPSSTHARRSLWRPNDKDSEVVMQSSALATKTTQKKNANLSHVVFPPAITTNQLFFFVCVCVWVQLAALSIFSLNEKCFRENSHSEHFYASGYFSALFPTTWIQIYVPSPPNGLVDYFFLKLFPQFVCIGIVTNIEVNHKAIETARKGQEVCIKISPTPGDSPKLYGRHFDHTDLLVSKVKLPFEND